MLAEKYNSIELGNSTSSLSNTISSINNTITEAISETMSTLQSSLAYQAKLLNGGLGGNVKINYNTKGRPCEIIVGDSDDISKMINCLRINYKGIGFSKNGYNGPYTSIWGLDGGFDGQCIKAGTIDGVSIKADTIQASSFTSAAKESLLSDVNDKISKIESNLESNSSILDELGGWLEIRNGRLYIGKKGSPILLRADNDDLSFIDESTTPPTVLAYISNNRFYTNELMLGGYKLSASDDAKVGLSFQWIGNISDS